MGKSVEEMLSGIDAWEAVVKENGFIDDDNRVRINEAFMSNDAPILFPRVISRVLREAAEPAQLITPLLDVVRLAQGRSMEFPAINAIRAFEVAEGQEFPEQALAFAKQIEGKVSKKGLRLAFTDEVISDSQWDIVGLHVRAAGRAMARLKEQIALGRFRDAATTVFDNDDNTKDPTKGINMHGIANKSLTFEDVVDMAAVLLAENHQPTDFIIHPLMWAVFLKGSYFMENGTGVTPGAWNSNINKPDQVVNQSTPLGLNALVSPFVGWTPRNGATPAKSDVFLVDRNGIGTILVKDDLSVDDWTDQSRDIKSLKLKERYDIVAFGEGEGITVAKNVDMVRNYEVEVVSNLS